MEDISPDLGCYGNPLAVTPNLDQMASNGTLFTNVISHGPVCSPVRSAMITGIMHTTIGVHNHHSSRTEASAIYLPDSIKTLPELFKEHGYFTFNQGKDDYNFWYHRPDLYSGDYTEHPLYGKSGQPMDWRQRHHPEQPFFGQIQLRGGKHVFNAQFDNMISQKVDRSKVKLPPYYPTDSIFVEEWARYLESHQITDREVGEILERLQTDGVLENTIVFFFADHGMRALRHKQFLYEGGLRVPLIMADFRDQSNGGKRNEGLVNLLDVSTTSLALAGIQPEEYLTGKDLLAPDYEPHEYVISARDRCDYTIDRIRSVHSGDFKYIRNFLTDRPILQPNYRDDWESTKHYRLLFENGQLTTSQAHLLQQPRPGEELYDLRNDPHETKNLADSSEFEPVLIRHRELLEDWVQRTNDQGQYPESEEGLKFMLAMWGDQAVNPEYQIVREKYPQLAGSLYQERFAKPRLITP